MDFDFPPPYDHEVPRRIGEARRQLSPEGVAVLEGIIAESGSLEDVIVAMESLPASDWHVLEAARIGRRLLERRARDARSFGELPSFPNDKELSPCPHSHHTSSSPSSSSSWPCSLTEWSITLWAATSLASPTG